MGEQTPNKDVVYYLGGPMTGIDQYNFPAFDRACELLRTGRGLNIKSAHEIDFEENSETRGSKPHAAYVRGGLKVMLECDGLILLPYWENSRGAELEYRVARGIDMPVFQIMTLDYKWWLDDKYDPILFLEKRVTRFPADILGPSV